MAMAVHAIEEPTFEPDPDTIKVPESPEHRRVVELIGVISDRLLGEEYVTYRDMNWYPSDQGAAIAPDVMVLPAGTLPEGARSYRQDKLDGPAPLVVVEVPSETNTFHDLQKKLRRYRRLGVPAYVVASEAQASCVMRQDPEDSTLTNWENQPIPELGGLRLASVNDRIVAGNGGIPLVESAAEWIESLHQLVDTQTRLLTAQTQRAEAEAQRAETEAQRAETEAQRAETEAQRAEAEAQRADRLAEQLRALGVAPAES